MIDYDPLFEPASIATQRKIFAEEEATGFALWRQLPSDETQARVHAWLQLGPRASNAHDQMLAHYYRSIGLEALLPRDLRSIKSQAEFDEWKSLSIHSQMGGFDPFGGLLPPPRIKDKRAKELVEESLGKKLIGFGSNAKPVFRTKTGCVVYLEVKQRNHLLGASLMCCRIETPTPLANHCGLHGIVTECKAETLTTSPTSVDVVVAEIIRHVDLMREKLM